MFDGYCRITGSLFGLFLGGEGTSQYNEVHNSTQSK